MTATDVRGVSINWESAGAGDPPFVLIPGYGSSIVKFRDAMPALATGRRAIALDLPGCGRSGAPRDGRYTPAWFAGGVRAFLDEIGVERAVIVGNSLGGLTGIHFAAAYPARTAALVAVAPVLPNDGPQPALRTTLGFLAPALPVLGPLAMRRNLSRDPERFVTESLARNFADPARVAPATRKLLEEEAAARANDPAVALAVTKASRAMMWAVTGGRERTWEVLRAVRAPTLFLWGDKDKMVPPHIGVRAIREVANAHYVEFEDCGHNPQMEKPEEFAATVLEFARTMAR
jgi:pimeloyl-ACP methyl ester carboxylesterase